MCPQVTSVNFARGSTTGRTFDFEMELKNGTTTIFNNIPRDEYTPLYDFVNVKNLRIKNKGNSKNGASSLDQMIDSDGEEGDAYLRQMKREGMIYTLVFVSGFLWVLCIFETRC